MLKDKIIYVSIKITVIITDKYWRKINMEIRKRNGQPELYSLDKIENAVRRAFGSVNQEYTQDEMAGIISAVEEKIQELAMREGIIQVEQIQDQIEMTLTEKNYYAVLKSFILYREKRSRLLCASSR